MATLHSVPSDGNIKTFKTFPEFSKLTYASRAMYEELVKGFPPYSDISFVGMMLWWNQLNGCSVSLLNDNLVVYYSLLGSEEMSGMSLIGTNKIDESLCTVFDYLRDKGLPPRLVHVPEFVLEHIEYPEMFTCTHDRDFDEYIFEVSKFYPLNHLISYRRHRVRKFQSLFDEDKVLVKSIDLSYEDERKQLLTCKWPKKGINKIVQAFDEVWEETIIQADILGVEGVGLYIDGELHAYCLYKPVPDKRYLIFRQAKVDYEVPYLFDYMVYAFARCFAEMGVQYINLDSDAGIPFLRMFMVALGPANYFRKYAIEPANK